MTSPESGKNWKPYSPKPEGQRRRGCAWGSRVGLMRDLRVGRWNQETGHCWRHCWTQRDLLPNSFPLHALGQCLPMAKPREKPMHTTLGNVACQRQKPLAMKAGHVDKNCIWEQTGNGPTHNPLKEVSLKKKQPTQFNQSFL